MRGRTVRVQHSLVTWSAPSRSFQFQHPTTSTPTPRPSLNSTMSQLVQILFPLPPTVATDCSAFENPLPGTALRRSILKCKGEPSSSKTCNVQPRDVISETGANRLLQPNVGRVSKQIRQLLPSSEYPQITLFSPAPEACLPPPTSTRQVTLRTLQQSRLLAD